MNEKLTHEERGTNIWRNNQKLTSVEVDTKVRRCSLAESND